MHEVSMILIIYDVQLGILGLKQVFFSDHYMAVLSWSVWKLAKVPSFCCYILQTFEADFLHSASQPYHMPYIIPVHIYRLTTRNHVSYSVLLSHVPFSHAGILGLGIFSYYWSGLPSIQRDLTKICWYAASRIRTPIFSGWFFFGKTLSFDQLMLSCSVVAVLSSLLGLVGLAGLGHHYYHHSPHGIFGEEVKDWSHDHHRHGHSMEAMKQILWWGWFVCFKQ